MVEQPVVLVVDNNSHVENAMAIASVLISQGLSILFDQRVSVPTLTRVASYTAQERAGVAVINTKRKSDVIVMSTPRHPAGVCVPVASVSKLVCTT